MPSEEKAKRKPKNKSIYRGLALGMLLGLSIIIVACIFCLFLFSLFPPIETDSPILQGLNSYIDFETTILEHFPLGLERAEVERRIEADLNATWSCGIHGGDLCVEIYIKAWLCDEDYRVEIVFSFESDRLSGVDVYDSACF